MAEPTASTPGQDVVDVLTTDHREALSLIDQIRAAAPSRQRELADVLISELVQHSVAEETFVYPAMREHLSDGDQAVDHDVEEHRQLERTMKDLEGCDPVDEQFAAMVTQLEGILRDHVQDEETEQFPRLRAEVPRDELVRMAERVETIKKIAPTRPHPDAPHGALFHVLAGPGVGLVDRLRDRLSGRVTS